MNKFVFTVHNYKENDGKIEFEAPVVFQFESEEYRKEQYRDDFGTYNTLVTFDTAGQVARAVCDKLNFSKLRFLSLEIDDLLPIRGIVKRVRAVKNYDILADAFGEDSTYSNLNKCVFSILISTLPDELWQQLVG